jgi:hypothetical protein
VKLHETIFRQKRQGHAKESESCRQAAHSQDTVWYSH